MRYIAFLPFIIILLFFSSRTYAGDSTVVYRCNSTFAIKGKVLPWTALFFPFSGINYTLGMEYGFDKVHAIGVELVYNDNSSHKDYYSSIKQNDSAGPFVYNVSRGVFLYYKRYLGVNKTFLSIPLSRMANDDVLPYVSVFARYGKTDTHYESDYITNNISHDEWQYSAGILVGSVAGVVDVNCGFFFKQKYITDVDLENNKPVIHHQIPSSLGFRIGVNLIGVLKRKSNHVLATDKPPYHAGSSMTR